MSVILGRRSPATFALIGGLIVAVAVLSGASIVRLLGHHRWVDRTEDNLRAIALLHATILEAQTGQRGFVISGNPRFLEPFERAVRDRPPQIAALRRETGDNPRQQAHLARLEEIADRRLDYMQGTIDLRRQGDLEGAIARVSSGVGEGQTRQLREVIRAMEAEEERLLLVRRAAAEREARLGLAFLIAASTLVTALVAGLGMATVRDSRRRVAAEAEKDEALARLGAERARLSLALEGAEQGLWDWHVPTGETYYSEGWAAMLGYTAAEVEPHVRSWERLAHPGDLPAAVAALQAHFRGDTPIYETEHRMRHRDGHWVWVLDRGKVIERDGTGGPLRMIGTHTDVTARRRADEELRRNRELLQTIFDHIPLFISRFDAAGRVEWVNRAWENTLGWTLAETQSVDILAVFFPDEADRARVVDFMLSGESGWQDFPLTTRSGAVIHSSWTNVRLSDGTWIGIGQDVTARAVAEQALRDSEERFRSVAENLGEGLLITDLEERVVYANPRVTEITGFTAGELKGRDAAEVFDVALTEAVQERMQRRREGSVERYDLPIRIKGGDRIVTEVTSSPFRDSAGQVIGSIRAFTDVTMLRRAEAALRTAEQLGMAGRLAGGAAHFYNNLMTVAHGNAAMLMQDLPAGDPMRDGLEEIAAAVARATRLTRQLQEFGERQVLRPARTDLNRLLVDLGAVLETQLSAHTRLGIHPAPDPVLVEIDVAAVTRAILEVALNARDAMPGGGRLDLSLATDAEGATVLVTDTGSGIADDVLPHIFEPFFTTRDRATVPGLGLSSARGTIQQNAGTIGVRSSSPQGTCFEIRFPRIPETGTSTPARPARAIPGDALVLVAEDEDAVRRVTTRVLTRGGYRVLEARNGTEARALLEHHPEPIHALVTDVVMPGGSGVEVARLARQRWPRIPVVLLSGHSEEDLRAHGGVDDLPLLEKPFTPDALLGTVRLHLGHAEGSG